jgi:hypothetical protein
MQVAINQIENKIKNFKRGKTFFLDDFAGLGTSRSRRFAIGVLVIDY